MRGIIYKWTNKINNKCYIGKTILKLPNIKGISKVINGHNKTYYGYTFTKIEDNTINKKETENDDVDTSKV